MWLFMFAISVNVADAERTERMLDNVLRSYVVFSLLLVIARRDRNSLHFGLYYSSASSEVNCKMSEMIILIKGKGAY